MNYPTPEQIDAVLARAKRKYGEDIRVSWQDFGATRLYWLGRRDASAEVRDALEKSTSLDGLAVDEVPPNATPDFGRNDSMSRTEFVRRAVLAMVTSHYPPSAEADRHKWVGNVRLSAEALADEMGYPRKGAAQDEVIPIVLTCPLCRQQHVDEGEWETRAHWAHKCVPGPFGNGCGHEWRPSNHPTRGVLYDYLRQETAG